MQAFAALLDRLVLTPQRNVKLRLLVDYFRVTPDPDRGYALAALTGDLDIPSVKPAMLRALVTERIDDVLFAYSYDYVGDLAETLSLVWRPRGDRHAGLQSETEGPHSLADRVGERRRQDDRSASPPSSSGCNAPRAPRGRGWSKRWLDRLDATGRYALIKLVAGGLRIGVSARLAKQALALLGGKRRSTRSRRPGPASSRPIVSLFAWLEGSGERPRGADPRAVPAGDAVSHALADARTRPDHARTTTRRSGSGTASASRRSARPASPGSTPAPPTTSPAPFPISSRRSISRAPSTASC